MDGQLAQLIHTEQFAGHGEGGDLPANVGDAAWRQDILLLQLLEQLLGRQTQARQALRVEINR